MNRWRRLGDRWGGLVETVIDALHRLGGRATVTDLRFATRFKLRRRDIVSALTWLKNRGVVATLPESQSWRNSKERVWTLVRP